MPGNLGTGGSWQNTRDKVFFRVSTCTIGSSEIQRKCTPLRPWVHKVAEAALANSLWPLRAEVVRSVGWSRAEILLRSAKKFRSREVCKPRTTFACVVVEGEARPVKTSLTLLYHNYRRGLGLSAGCMPTLGGTKCL